MTSGPNFVVGPNPDLSAAKSLNDPSPEPPGMMDKAVVWWDSKSLLEKSAWAGGGLFVAVGLALLVTRSKRATPNRRSGPRLSKQEERQALSGVMRTRRAKAWLRHRGVEASDLPPSARAWFRRR